MSTNIASLILYLGNLTVMILIRYSLFLIFLNCYSNLVGQIITNYQTLSNADCHGNNAVLEIEILNGSGFYNVSIDLPYTSLTQGGTGTTYIFSGISSVASPINNGNYCNVNIEDLVTGENVSTIAFIDKDEVNNTTGFMTQINTCSCNEPIDLSTFINSNGTPPYSVNFIFGSNPNQISPIQLCPGIHETNVTDANGCNVYTHTIAGVASTQWTLDISPDTNLITHIDSRTECDSLIWIDGNTYYTNNNTATYNFVGAANGGCDSLVILDLTILHSAVGTDTRTACDSLIWIDGNTYFNSNSVATHIITGGSATGCDSIVTLDLTINTVSDVTTSISGTNITANNLSGSYQWLNCDSNYTEIPGAININFNPTQNGNYAVQINENGCVDTSECVLFSNFVSIRSKDDYLTLIYPNPTNGLLNIDLKNSANEVDILVKDLSGRLIQCHKASPFHINQIYLPASTGIYILEILNGEQINSIRILKN